MVRRIILFVFAATVALAPLPLGSNRDWSWSPLAVIVGLLLVIWAAALACMPDERKSSLVSFRALAVPVVLIGLVIVWGIVQMSGLTPASWANPISASTAFGPAAATHAITFESEQPVIGMMRLLTYIGVFVLAASLSSNGVDARRILAPMVLCACLFTLYSMTAYVINGQTSITGLTIWTPHEPFFTGSFVNGNNYATYAGVMTMTALALGIRPSRSGEHRESAHQRWRRRIALLSGRSGLWVAASLFLATGVMMSGSRAGWVSFAVAFMTFLALYARGPARVAWLVITPLLFALLVILSPGGEMLLTKTARLINEGEQGREMLFPMTLDAIALRPVLGWGMNSFESLYTVLQPVAVGDYFDKAHNTYLELAFDLGVPAAAMLVFAVAWVVVRCLIGFFTRGRDGELAGLGFIASVLVGFHALFDFSLQIPAVACSYAAILGVAWAQSWSSRRETG